MSLSQPGLQRASGQQDYGGNSSLREREKYREEKERKKERKRRVYTRRQIFTVLQAPYLSCLYDITLQATHTLGTMEDGTKGLSVYLAISHLIIHPFICRVNISDDDSKITIIDGALK